MENVVDEGEDSGEEESFDEFNVEHESFSNRVFRSSHGTSLIGMERINYSVDNQFEGNETQSNFGDNTGASENEDVFWTLDDCEKLVQLYLNDENEKSGSPRDWEAIASQMNKSVNSCKKWLLFLLQVEDLQNIYEDRAQSILDPMQKSEVSKKRQRDDSLESVSGNPNPEGDEDIEPSVSKKSRRHAKDIDREWDCQHCSKSYGRFKSLKEHHSLKHEALEFNEGEVISKRNLKLLNKSIAAVSPQFTVPLTSLLTNYLATPGPLVSALQGQAILAENPYHSIPHLLNIANVAGDTSRTLQNQVSLSMLNNSRYLGQSLATSHVPQQDTVNLPVGDGSQMNFTAEGGSMSDSYSSGVPTSVCNWANLPRIEAPQPFSSFFGPLPGFSLYNLNIGKRAAQNVSLGESSPDLPGPSDSIRHFGRARDGQLQGEHAEFNSIDRSSDNERRQDWTDS